MCLRLPGAVAATRRCGGNISAAWTVKSINAE
jgi:hypothetical protein